MFQFECFKIQLLSFRDSDDIFNLKKGRPIYKIDCLSPYCVPNPTLIEADPFLFVKGETLYLFYEHKLWQDPGVLNMVCTKDLKHWSKPVTVLKEPYHLSFPWVFEEDGRIYMIPETGAGHEIRLYEATDADLTRFELVKVLMKEPFDKSFVMHYADNCIYKKGGIYYLFTQVQYEDGINTLELYISNSIMGEYRPHPSSPIQHSQKLGRNAGCLLELNGKLLRFSQDCVVRYGDNVHVSEITEISPTGYKELLVKENIIPTDDRFYINGGHQFNAVQFKDQWIVATDAKEYHKLIGQKIINKIIHTLI
ncbi:hypothetical protein L6472_10165 [Prevotella sp. E13-17]|uniref:glucosamine inositolphosphorylceramide transferase family protein n=1 Tax=Prevotella sp. E13-17 TaxID=2913616 RepID=UPI001EDBFADE|nr:hypothetical protein [Prevotella sp. E13-17]UKK50384.1 hypothetical protein L6472_10165 [Prevotella sp. E13-17]